MRKMFLWFDETKIKLFGLNVHFICQEAAWWLQHHAVGMLFIMRESVSDQEFGKQGKKQNSGLIQEHLPPFKLSQPQRKAR